MMHAIADGSDEARGHALSVCQRQVLEAAASGAVTSEVALVLGMTDDVVRQHMAAAVRALGARSKLEALIIALRHGLLCADGDAAS